MTTTLLPAQRAALNHLTRGHKGDTMLTFLYPTDTTADQAPNWYIQRQLDTALQQARQEEAQTMTAPTHTPGPWTMEQPYGEPGTYITRPETTELIAKVYTPDNPRETQPNARLLAAAPELLAALIAARDVLEAAKQYFPKSIRNRDRFSLANVLANAVNPAIAKATGAPTS